MHLATIESQEVYEQVREEIKANRDAFGEDPFDGSDQVWIGLNDRNFEGTFVWQETGDTLKDVEGFTHPWYTNEPDNSFDRCTTEAEDAVMMSYYGDYDYGYGTIPWGGHWSDNCTNDTEFFICQK